MPRRVRVDESRGPHCPRAESLPYDVHRPLDCCTPFYALVGDARVVTDCEHRLLDLYRIAELRTRDAEQPNAASDIEVVEQFASGREDLGAQIRWFRKRPGARARLEVGEPHLQRDRSGGELLVTDTRADPIGEPHQLAIARGARTKVRAECLFGA